MRTTIINEIDNNANCHNDEILYKLSLFWLQLGIKTKACKKCKSGACPKKKKGKVGMMYIDFCVNK